MVSLAIWVAAALFLAYAGFILLGLLAAMLKSLVRSTGTTRYPKSRPIRFRPVFVRTKHDKVVGIFVVIAASILVTLIVISVVYYPAYAGQ
jgi:hypothetical protein